VLLLLPSLAESRGLAHRDRLPRFRHKPSFYGPIDQRIQSRKISKLITRGTKDMTPLSVAGGAPNGPEAFQRLGPTPDSMRTPVSSLAC
jgi:hypothetical protein